ncbi:MAG: hypothetical protein HY587_01520 [Candidatus Omnitrophica bacterium]|nr:hypothetical protein [Candidatus Omnitrophota bacterium]
MSGFERIYYWLWLLAVSHGLVWGPCLVIDFLFCKGKMLKDPFSLAIIETVSIVFLTAKHTQLQKQR